MRRLFPLLPLLALAAAGCTAGEAGAPPTPAIANDTDPVPATRVETRPAPVLVTIQRAATDPVPLAILGGVLDLAGPCVRIQSSDGVLRTLVMPRGVTVLRDEAGFYLPVLNDRLRHGTSIVGGGGEMGTLPATGPGGLVVPRTCEGRGVFLVGIHRAPAPRSGGVAEPPPPPSAG